MEDGRGCYVQLLLGRCLVINVGMSVVLLGWYRRKLQRELEDHLPDFLALCKRCREISRAMERDAPLKFATPEIARDSQRRQRS